MADEGVQLMDCYSGSATCSPTRLSLMTGGLLKAVYAASFAGIRAGLPSAALLMLLAAAGAGIARFLTQA